MFPSNRFNLVSQKYQDSYMAATKLAAKTGDYVYECVLSDGHHSFLTGRQLSYMSERNFIAKSHIIV